MSLSSVPLSGNASERRVRTLKLSAPEEGLIRRGAAVLEDALRTASLPWADGGHLVFVRRLDLSSIRPDLGPARVARLLEERLRRAGAEAVHAEHPAAGDRSAVYFRDAAEPAVCLARRLARGRAAEAWFWPLAVPAWQPIRAPSEGLRRLLHGVVQAPMGPAVAPVLARALLETGDLDPMLAALEPDDGPALLRASAWQGAGQSPSSGEAPWLESAAPLATWSRRWGIDDARSLWLAATLLVAEQPARRLDPRLTERARALLEQVSPDRVSPDRVSPDRVSPDRVARDRVAPDQVSQDRIAPDRIVSDRVTRERGAPDQTVAGRLPAAVEEGLATERIATDAAGGDPLGPPAGSASSGGAEPPPAAGPDPHARPPVPGAVSKAGAVVLTTSVEEQAPVIPPTKSLAGDAREGGRPARAAPEEAIQGAGATPAGDGSLRPRPAPTYEPPSGADRRPETAGSAAEEASGRVRDRSAPSQAAPRALPKEPLMSAHAGLLLLLPALERLGIAELFARHHQLVECDLPARLLHHFGERLGIPEDDPVRRALPAIRPRTARPRRSEDPGPGLAPRLLLDSWLIAARLWCRRHARVRLHDLVHRRGEVTATPTHIDVFFDLRQVDMRIRQAGLDLDPGWLPWLGRVVLFHYLEGV